MCGRYSLVCIDDLGNRFRVFNPMMGARSRFNVAPGNEMPVIVGGDTRGLTLMQWGLVPGFTCDISSARRPINARAETLRENPVFRHLVRDRRCLVPASGFYEWKKEGNRKVPFYFHLHDTPLFAFAGLYDRWTCPDGAALSTYTIITCKSNACLAGIHDRMPAILSPGHEKHWISGESLTAEEMERMLAPFPAEHMTAYPVLPLVNSPSTDDERLVQPLNSSAGKQTVLEE
ncbi:SOS response-associated peptidase [uncultured Methanoregula sp.]|uniref:SOS response-associated peptidase n=1 Tax=uncultured Methanoregula sp. TaxID=1005933 RepID=UPI002AAB9069|nr:SOS response-associated peptidase [uncultured Methanoregula sp.]